MKLGIIGKPQSGKTTIFNAAAGAQEAVGDFSRSVHKAVVKVPDGRLHELAKLLTPKKITPAEIEFLDAAGLKADGKKKSDGLEVNPELRQQDAFILVVDAFSPGSDPELAVKNLKDEMIILDQAVLEKNIEKKEKRLKLKADRGIIFELELLKRCLAHVESEKTLLDLELNDDEAKFIKSYMFLSIKPVLVILNIAEKDISKSLDIEKRYAHFVNLGRRELAVVCGKIEAELVPLKNDERAIFLEALAIDHSAMEQVIQKSYKLLGLISFLTAGEEEVRAWTIRNGLNAQQAAGAIHGDMERGFIRAEVIKYEDYVKYKTEAAAKAAAKMRLEGKTYIVEDGDVITFRFNI